MWWKYCIDGYVQGNTLRFSPFIGLRIQLDLVTGHVTIDEYIKYPAFINAVFITDIYS